MKKYSDEFVEKAIIEAKKVCEEMHPEFAFDVMEEIGESEMWKGLSKEQKKRVKKEMKEIRRRW